MSSRQGTSERKNEIRESLSPEIKNISNEELREKVISAWAMALEETSFNSLKEVGQFKGINTAEHVRGVAAIALGIVEGIKKLYPNLSINVDTVVAGALCHDVGKPFEYDPDNKSNWDKNRWTTGNPPFRHSIYGGHIALNAGLPLEICHVVGSHSIEGTYLQRSVEASIVCYADKVFWEIVGRAKFGKNLFELAGIIQKEMY